MLMPKNSNVKTIIPPTSTGVVKLKVPNAAPLILSGREVQVLRLTADGFTAREISSQLGITDHTVKMHRKNMLAKNKMRNTYEMVKFGVVHKIIS